MSAETDFQTWEQEQAAVPFDDLPVFNGTEMEKTVQVYTWWLTHRD